MATATAIACTLEQVLAAGEIDDGSRRLLARLYRTTMAGLASRAEQPGEMTDRAFCDSYFDHIASISVLHAFTPQDRRGRLHRALYDARLAWFDELDLMTDDDLLAVRRIGRVSIEDLRFALEAYYWRGDRSRSRDGWQRVASHMRRTLDYPYLGYRRARVEAGLTFAQEALARGAEIERWAPRRAVA